MVVGLLLVFNHQGGRKLNLTIYDGKKYDVQFPIAYAKECIGEKAKIYYASSSAIPRVMVFGIA